MAHAIYSPNPDTHALQQTKAARFLKSDGSVVIGFCVDTQGETTDLEVLEPFPGDSSVGEILLATVDTWRFEPFMVDGRPMKTCSRKTFILRFKGANPRPPASAQTLEPLPPSLALDICVHIKDMMTAVITNAGVDFSEAEVAQFLHYCVDDIESQRQAQSDGAFVRRAACILRAESMEAVAACDSP